MQRCGIVLLSHPKVGVWRLRSTPQPEFPLLTPLASLAPGLNSLPLSGRCKLRGHKYDQNCEERYKNVAKSYFLSHPKVVTTARVSVVGFVRSAIKDSSSSRAVQAPQPYVHTTKEFRSDDSIVLVS